MTSRSKPRPRKPRALRLTNGSGGKSTVAYLSPLEQNLCSMSSLLTANQARALADWLLRGADWLDAQAPARKAKP